MKTIINLYFFTFLFHSSIFAQNSSEKIIEYKTYEDSLYSLLILDFKSNYSFFINYYGPNIRQSEGSFDLTTFDSLKFFYDTIFLYQSPVDGTRSSVTQEFHSMKEGLWKYYYSNGTLHSIGTYKRNLKEGEWKYFGDDEELKIIRSYSQGKIMEQKIVAVGSFVFPEE